MAGLLSCEGSDQFTSEEEESPVLTFGKVQKKPATTCCKQSKATPQSKATLQKAMAVESDSAESQFTSDSASELPGTFPNPGDSGAPKREGSSSETSETKRIKAAEQAWQAGPVKKKPSAPKEAESSTQETSGSSDAMANPQTEIPKPTSSGLLDYCTWMVDQLSSEERESAVANWWQKYAEFCAGMGTGLICFESLSRAMGTHQLKVNALCACLTEKIPWRAKAISALLEDLQPSTSDSPSCPILHRTGDLQNLVLRDFKEQVVIDKPTFDLLLQGIDCIDISSLTSTPKSVMDITGESGRSLRELLQYLESLDFKDRPEGIILECVLRLAHKRKRGLPQPEVGTELVSEKLRFLGYVGSWEPQDPLKVYLPQSRKRTWAIYLKVKLSGPNPMDAERKRREDVSRAFSIVNRLKVPKHEPLQTVLDRLRIEPNVGKPKAKSKGRPPKVAEPEAQSKQLPNMSLDWTKMAGPKKSMKHLGITPADLVAGMDLKDFWQEAATMMNQSCARHALMRLASLKKRGKVPDWRKTILAFNADESGYRQGVGIMRFPCVQPKRLHILALNGKLVKADGQLCLAMQGIQSKELKAFPALSKQTSNKQQEWAGNAFTANTCAAFILAVAVVR